MLIPDWKRLGESWVFNLEYLAVYAPTLRQRCYARFILKKVGHHIDSKQKAKLLAKFVRPKSYSKNPNPETMWTEKALNNLHFFGEEVLCMKQCFNAWNLTQETRHITQDLQRIIIGFL